VEGILTPLFATHTGILTSKRSTASHEAASLLLGTLPYHRVGFTPTSRSRLAGNIWPQTSIQIESSSTELQAQPAEGGLAPNAQSPWKVFGNQASLLSFPQRQSETDTIHSFGESFSPVTFSAQSHLTSELLRTL
jgi:hypothetical protein